MPAAEILYDSQSVPPPVDEATVLLHLDGSEKWTLKDAFEGTHIFGSTGSGKTSGSGRTLAIQFLKSGMGGLVLTAKPDECDEWRKYAAAAGRSPDDFIILSPDNPYSFGFFEYERQIAQSENIPVTETIVNLFGVLLEVSQRKSGDGKDAYWQLAVKQLVRNATDLLLFAGKELSFENLYSLIASAPTTPADASTVTESFNDPRAAAKSFFMECVSAASKSEDRTAPALRLTLTFFISEYPNLAPETRSSVVSYFTTIADVFSRGILNKLFSPAASPEHNFSPDLSRQGKILIIDLPVKRYNETGQLAEVLYKFCWQRAAERQAGSTKMRPTFLWADESHFCCNSGDFLFQTTARSAKVATVYLTQNISNYYAVMPGERGKAETDSLLGNFNTKIFHANNDSVTNIWAADLIGKNWQFRNSFASSVSSSQNNPAKQNIFSLKSLFQSSGTGTSTNVNRSKNEVLEYQIIPLAFCRLAKGGITGDPATDRTVEGIFTQSGRILKTGTNYQMLQFFQEGKK